MLLQPQSSTARPDRGISKANLFPTPKDAGIREAKVALTPGASAVTSAETGSTAFNFTIKLIPSALEGIDDGAQKGLHRRNNPYFMALKGGLINIILAYFNLKNPM